MSVRGKNGIRREQGGCHSVRSQLASVQTKILEWLKDHIFSEEQMLVKSDEFEHVFQSALEVVTQDILLSFTQNHL